MDHNEFAPPRMDRYVDCQTILKLSSQLLEREPPLSQACRARLLQIRAVAYVHARALERLVGEARIGTS
jgi:hypothetical protein